MNAVKFVVIVIYLLALAGVLEWIPAGLAEPLQLLSLFLVIVHIGEVIFAFKYIRRHRGDLADSIALTLLFGFLHWLPLRQGKATATQR